MIGNRGPGDAGSDRPGDTGLSRQGAGTPGGYRVTVAGHICLDVIPQFAGPARLEPGTLNEIGPARFATGGAVANVGLALERLGVDVRLAGRLGDDPFGSILERLLDIGPSPSRQGLERVRGARTSYSIVVNPPGVDRMFLHHADCNDDFRSPAPPPRVS